MTEAYKGYGTVPTSSSEGKRPSRSYKFLSELPDSFSPPFDNEGRVSTVTVGIFNILNTCVGGGTLSLPYAFSKCGWLIATLLCIFSMLCSIFSMKILCTLARKLGCSSYSDIMEKALGYSGKRATSFILFFILILVLIAFLVLLRDIAVAVVEFFTPDNYHLSVQLKNLVTIVLTSVSFPLMTSDNLHALRYVSYAGSICVFILLCTICQKTYTVNVTSPASYEHAPVRWGPESASDLFAAIPIIFISFLCQFNVLGVYSDLHRPSTENIDAVINRSMLISATLFTCFGLAGYFFAFDDTADNILNNFSSRDPAVLVARFGLTFTLMCQLPMVMVPCRQALYPLLWPEINTADNHSLNLTDGVVVDSHYSSPGGGLTPLEGEEESAGFRRLRALSRGNSDAILREALAYRVRVLSFAENSEQAVEALEGATLLPVDRGFDIAVSGASTRYLVTFVLISLALILSETVPGVSTIWSIVGSTLSIAIAFLLPGFSYICTWKKLGPSRQMDDAVLGSYFLIILSAVLITVCTYATLSKLFE